MANCPECQSEDYNLEYGEQPNCYAHECMALIDLEIEPYTFCRDCGYYEQLPVIKLQLTPENIERLQNG